MQQNDRPKTAPTQINHSSDKLLRLIELLATQQEPVRLQTLAAGLGMNGSTVLRFLAALMQRGYAAQDPDTGRYYLTLKLCGLAQSISKRSDITKLAQPFLQDAARLFGESCNLAVDREMSVVYIQVVNVPDQTLMTTQHIGKVAPLHCTGIGKLFLSEYGSERINKYSTTSGLGKYTDKTIISQKKLLEELETVRRTGCAYDNEECEIGARCVAVPVRDYTGGIVAGISVSGPAVRMTDAHIARHLPQLAALAGQLSRLMGWEPGAEAHQKPPAAGGA